MSKDTAISWATDSFNSHWGCTEVPDSPACENCYAREFSKRLGLNLWGNDKPRRFFGDKHWNEPRKWDALAKKEGNRRRIFVNSMSDTFEGRAELDPVRDRLWKLIPETSSCDYLLLTKRPQNVLRMVPKEWLNSWPKNAWVGTTAENQKWADIRLPFLEKVPAPMIFISAEPLLGPLNLRPYLKFARWVLIGGESGKPIEKVRRMELDWVKDIFKQCQEAGATIHFKQMGAVLAKQMGLKDAAGKKSYEWPVEYQIQHYPVVA